LQALDYINTHLYTVRDVREISSALFVTETYFFRVFKEQMHISPKKYITKKRLLAAERRISAGERPTEVYLQCGFHTYTAFYKRYVDFFGKAPSEH
jgi:AraC-like DNA-binding protein